MSKRRCLYFVIFLSIAFFFILGKCLDGEAERVINQFYPRDNQGIILGDEPVEITSPGNTKAIVLIHGFLDTPRIFTNVIQELQSRPIKADIYAPLLPKHGRNLEIAAQLNNDEEIEFIADYLNDLANKYDCITVNGLSYGGAILSELALSKRLPKNIHLILEAPAVHIQLNTQFNRVRNHLFGLWRNYCNYQLLGCHLSQKGLDNKTKEELLNERNFKYKIVSSSFQLFDLDLKLRNRISLIRQPYSILISEHDNRLIYEDVAQECQDNIEYCDLYSFPTGGHILHYGDNQERFIEILLKYNNCELHSSNSN